MVIRKKNSDGSGIDNYTESMNIDKIVIKGAREHNLKNIDVEIPRSKFVVITGLSGSGKSSLAFDTLYAEGQRRYVESLSAYARQFLGLMEKPDVDYIEGLSPAISIEQKSGVRNPRSTVGTVTEIYDYLRLLFARVGRPYCYRCGKPITSQTIQQMVDIILEMPEHTKIQILSPLVRGRKGEYRELFEQIRKDGYIRVRVDKEVYELDKPIRLSKTQKHTIEVVIDRLVVSPKIRPRLSDSLQTALSLSSGLVVVDREGGEEKLFSEKLSCASCGVSYDELAPRFFSFNSPFGACPACSGLGTQPEIEPDLIVPDPRLSINQSAIAAWGNMKGSYYGKMIQAVAKHYKIDLNKPFKDLPKNQKTILLYGSGEQEIKFAWEFENGKGRGEFNRSYEGVIPNLLRRYTQSESDDIREWIEGFMTSHLCQQCNGKRLKPEALSIKINGMNIADITSLSIRKTLEVFNEFRFSQREETIARTILKEIKERLGFLINVGLDYLTLDRSAGSLSGGEAQRIRLATQIGSQLTGVLYILDEPSIGLHQRDNRRLLDSLLRLRDMGNTVIVVEHDRETIESADWVIDLGPGAGIHGGELVAEGTPDQIRRNERSITGQYLSGKKIIPVPATRRKGNGNSILLRGCAGHNLKNIDARFPLGCFIVVTGVSGSGKSTLINETLFPMMARHFYGAKMQPLSHQKMEGLEHIDKVIDIDQSPIGRTPRSNPATYTKLFDPIRNLFSQLPESKIRGYDQGRFSFNVKGGRCEACRGDGIMKIEMHFLPDVYVPCEVCKGKRYNRETLEIRYKGKNISEILDMTVDEALVFLENIPHAKAKLETLSSVGLGYIHLGQQATTLSGGEAQRVKLSTELSKRSTGRTFYILDEPTTGLHFDDIRMLLKVLTNLVDRGNTVLVIEHNIDVIKVADWVIDLGPEGGDLGGEIVAQGTPQEVAKNSRSYTGKYL